MARTPGQRLRNLGAAAAGYLLGAIPSADIAARSATRGAVDLRVDGSGNPGALNAIGVLGRRWGYAVGVVDVAKGAAGAWLGREIAGDVVGGHIGGTAAVLGHCYPPWSGFRGGKGVAAAAGQFLATFPAALPVEIAAGGFGALAPRRRSLAIAVALGTGWVASAVLWWRKGWSTWWGPPATATLPVAAATSTSIVLFRFLRRQTR